VKDLALRLAGLGRALRARGVGVTLRDELDGAAALAVVDAADREEVRTALRIALRIPRADFEIFDRLFGVFWADEPPVVEPVAPRRPVEAPDAAGSPALRWDPEARRMGAAPAQGRQPGFSPEALLRRKPFDRDWSSRDLAAMERLLARLARRLATRRSRRLVPTRGRGRADVRASYRRALRSSGELLDLARRARAVAAPRVVFLLDTSGSMDAHTRFLLTFALALRRAVPSAELFAFNTELVRLSSRLTLERLAAAVPDWSGGTRIGDCLAAFLEDHFSRAPAGRTVVVILSDGLARTVRLIRRRARRLVWLNPLAGDPRYVADAAGMRAALPHVDHFASAHDYASLERLIPQLEP
jgi:uncharacterized protein with von Willebrand factor type A (vWA) domain